MKLLGLSMIRLSTPLLGERQKNGLSITKKNVVNKGYITCGN